MIQNFRYVLVVFMVVFLWESMVRGEWDTTTKIVMIVLGILVILLNELVLYVLRSAASIGLKRKINFLDVMKEVTGEEECRVVHEKDGLYNVVQGSKQYHFYTEKDGYTVRKVIHKDEIVYEGGED